jgi:bifunctional UDP-N-acetylglucosamine pyrophosphorylase/glucosamine-1-phosphate N-acetyltransferase
MVVRASLLGPALRLVGRANAQNEYYLTDLVGVLFESGHLTQSIVLDDAAEASGVNNLRQLSEAERVLRRRINERWLDRGVTIWSPDDTYIDAEVELAAEVSLLPGTVLKGTCAIEMGARIGPNAVLDDVRVGANAVVGMIEATGATIGAEARVSSFVVLAPGAVVEPGELVTPFHFRTH